MQLAPQYFLTQPNNGDETSSVHQCQFREVFPQLLPRCVHLQGPIRVILRPEGDLLQALLLAQLDHVDLILRAPASVTAGRIGSCFPFFPFLEYMYKACFYQQPVYMVKR